MQGQCEARVEQGGLVGKVVMMPMQATHVRRASCAHVCEARVRQCNIVCECCVRQCKIVQEGGVRQRVVGPHAGHEARPHKLPIKG